MEDQVTPTAHPSRGAFAKTLLLAGCAGALLALAAVPVSLTVFAFCFAPLLMWTLERIEAKAWVRAMIAGLLAGTVCNAVAFYWIVPLLQEFGEFPLWVALPISALLFVAQGTPYAIGASVASILRLRGVPLWLGLPATLSIAVTLVPALFPWHPSATLIAWLPWVQLAEVGGEPLLDTLLHFSGCALVAGVVQRNRRLVAAGLLVAVVPAIYGSWRIPQVESERQSAEILRVGVVQHNISIENKYDAREHSATLKTLQEMSKAAEEQGAELVVWSETAYPFRIPRNRNQDMPTNMRILSEGVHGPLLIGAITQTGPCDRWNSVIALDSSGEFVGMSDKVKRLAFGEFVPLWHWLPPLQKRFRCPGVVAGKRPLTLTLAQSRIGVLNCYEDVLSSYTRAVMDGKPEFLVNLTNDAWFGDTTEPLLHHMVARLRSIETRRDLVRAVNTGVSGHITATGANAYRTQTWTRAVFVIDVRRLSGNTLFVRLGDWCTPLLVLALAFAAFRRSPAVTA